MEVINDSSNNDDRPLVAPRKKAGKRGGQVQQSDHEDSDIEIMSGPSNTKALKAKKAPLVTVKKEKGTAQAESSNAACKCKRVVPEDEESDAEDSEVEENNNNDKDEDEDSKAGQCPQIKLKGTRPEERVQELAQYGQPNKCKYCRINDLECNLKMPPHMKFKIGEDGLTGLSCQECKMRCIWYGLPAPIPHKDAKHSLVLSKSAKLDSQPVKVVIAEKGT